MDFTLSSEGKLLKPSSASSNSRLMGDRRIRHMDDPANPPAADADGLLGEYHYEPQTDAYKQRSPRQMPPSRLNRRTIEDIHLPGRDTRDRDSTTRVPDGNFYDERGRRERPYVRSEIPNKGGAFRQSQSSSFDRYPDLTEVERLTGSRLSHANGGRERMVQILRGNCDERPSSSSSSRYRYPSRETVPYSSAVEYGYEDQQSKDFCSPYLIESEASSSSYSRDEECAIYQKSIKDKDSSHTSKMYSPYSRDPRPTKYKTPGAEMVSEKTIEIAPGHFVRLRGADETWRAIACDFYMPCECVCCNLTIFCIQDAHYVLCPECRVVSSMITDGVEAKEGSGGGGVGLGFKMDDLAQWQEEIGKEREHSSEKK